jgi:hypothetical protein
VRRWWLLALATLAQLTPARAAHAQDPASPLRSNDFAVELFRGPVLAPLRVTGLAGAYAGVGEGISGLPANAASPAVRPFYSIDSFDYDLAASLSVPLPLAEPNDFDNSGSRDSDDSQFIYATGGALLQAGAFGAGALVELERYSIVVGGDTTTTLVARYHALVAVGLGEGQVVVGGGVRAVTMGIDAPEANLTLAGIAPQLGVLVRPTDVPFRVGATVRAPVDAGALGEGAPVGEDGVRRLGGLVLPDAVVWPTEVEVGFAWQLGPKPLNRRFVDPDEDLSAARAAAAQRGVGEEGREAQEVRLRNARIDASRSLPREHLLVTGALLATGPVSEAISLEGFLAQRRTDGDALAEPGSAGARFSFSPRVGLQAEPLPNWLQMRFGTYYEPSRFDRTGREHFTFGADLRVLSTRLFGLAPDGVTYAVLGAVDIAPRYESISLGIGVWR